jgi:hypothetical protein
MQNQHYSKGNNDRRPAFQREKSPEDADYVYCTGGKTPEFAVFFNRAVDQISKIVHEYAEQKADTPSKSLALFLEDPQKRTTRLFIILRNFIYKGYQSNPNSSGIEQVSNKESDIIVKLVQKLVDLRNFHSHYYHKSTHIEFSKELRDFIRDLHCNAERSFEGTKSSELTRYHEKLREFPHFDEKNGKFYIKQEGRTFFLGLFLTTGQMSHFLQQRSGSKRNNLPEFKIKHEIYKFYCHRDGATRKYYTPEELNNESVFENLSDAKMAAQGLQVVSYLNDIPQTYLNEQSILFQLDGDTVEELDQLVAFALKTEGFTDIFQIETAIKHIIPKETDSSNSRYHSNASVHEAYDKQIGIQLKLVKYPEHHFLLRPKDVKQILLEYLRPMRPKEVQHILPATLNADQPNDQECLPRSLFDRFEFFIKERAAILNILELGFQEETTPEKITESLLDWKKFALRNEKEQEYLSSWIDRGKDFKTIRTKMLDSHLETKPIELVFNHLFQGEEQKPRRENLFMQHAVRYLIDHKIAPSYNFMQQREGFVGDLDKITANVKHRAESISPLTFKRLTVFHSEVVQGFHLAFTPDNQINVAVKDADKTYYFTLGHIAMRNLIACSITKGYSIDSFFAKIISDLKIIHAGSLIDLKYLGKQHIPYAMAVSAGLKVTEKDLIESASKRITSLIDSIKGLVSAPKKLRRADKNRFIMRCYTLFDWEYAHDSKFKFLRKSEYKNLSIYHYLLDKRDISGKTLVEGTYGKLLKGHSFNGDLDLLSHMPKEIKTLLLHSDSFEALFLGVLEAARKKLVKMKEALRDPMKPFASKKNIFAKIGINAKTDINQEFNPYLPFAIHPGLPFMVFETPDDFISGMRRNTSLVKGLAFKYDDTEYLYRFWPDHAKKTAQLPSKRTFIGKANDEFTQDILLWQIAKKYLKESKTYSATLTDGKSESEWNIGSLSKSLFQTKDYLLDSGEKVRLNLRFHQMNSALLLLQPLELEKLISHTFARLKALSLLGDKRFYTKLVKDNKTVYTIPLDELFKEQNRILADSLQWAGAIFVWEKKIVDKSKGNIHALANQKTTEDELQSRVPYVSFSEVLKLSNLDESQKSRIKNDVRNVCFHSKIPDIGKNWWQLEKDADLCRILDFVRKERLTTQ